MNLNLVHETMNRKGLRIEENSVFSSLGKFLSVVLNNFTNFIYSFKKLYFVKEL